MRAKLRVRDDSAVARVGQMNLSVVRRPSGRPAGRPSGIRGPGTLSVLLAWVFFEDVQLSLTSVFVYRSR